MKRLMDLLYKTGITELSGDTSILVHTICTDNRKVTSDSVFVAVRGTNTDGHIYIDSAIDHGATSVVCEEFPSTLRKGITYVKVRSSSIALGFMASNFYDNPSSKMKVVGVTGTNGKTTVATLLYQLFSHSNKCGLISTVKYIVNDEIIPSTHTTPDAVSLNGLMSHMVDEGCTYCFMEVSSHAIEQNRIAGLDFVGGVFTNLTHDHLDYHKNFDNYLHAKKSFFDSLSTESFALTNADDKNGRVMLQNTTARKMTYSLKSMSDFKAKVIENSLSGLLLNIDGYEVSCFLIGNFNAYNILAVYGASVLLGEDKLKVLEEISKLIPVEGRFEAVASSGKVIGIVDYAHTPDALENVLSTIRDAKTGSEKIITVVGCGGDRDDTKRPLMAKIACELSDRIILTSDNPRSEDPEFILNQMQAGVPSFHRAKTLMISDRREAIKTACTLANEGDIILVAGKGHEKYQEIKGVKYPFDDKQVLEEMMRLIISG